MSVRDGVQDYYGKVLTASADLQTDACCTESDVPLWLRPILSAIHPEVSDKYYGCGLVAPEQLLGASVLDLGSGSGRDCYALSALVGEAGRVVGVDMTEEQLAVARRHRDFHADAFGFPSSNVEFHHGFLETLEKLPLQSDEFDVVVSNCVINLCQDKQKVLADVWRLLREGGEFYFSDVYADRRIDPSLQDDPVLYGECLSGALYWKDFLRLAQQAAFADPRLVTSRPLAVNNPALQEKLGATKFWSATWRLFKLPALEDACEEYGQAVIYRGTIAHHRDSVELDAHHFIETGKVFPVCGNTWRMLKETRFAEHFEFIGDFSTHYGIYAGCGTDVPFQNALGDNGAACC
jgi:ubiquinone/menaquinone biosynthesis C-methylase UbiE